MPMPSPPAQRSGGAEGNERLTAMTGAVPLILLAVECYTIFRIGRLLTLHVFLGMLLLGPVTLKAGSVIYRRCRR
jgi:multisubunit Na+/H+ antiporter MnhG subunit